MHPSARIHMLVAETNVLGATCSSGALSIPTCTPTLMAQGHLATQENVGRGLNNVPTVSLLSEPQWKRTLVQPTMKIKVAEVLDKVVCMEGTTKLL